MKWLIFVLFITPTCFASEVNTIESGSFKKSKFRHHDGLGAPQLPPGYDLPEELWFTQDLDHFRPTEDRTWKQRYWVNDTFYKPGGPAFLMIGGEGPANPIWMVTGTWIEYAQEFGAICFQLEHRYYGQSHPTEDMSVKNLIWLNSEQALADLATFISAMNEKYTPSKWISFGGSYPGSLAAWFRLKYPHLVHGSVSTSGPLIAKADFPEYLEVVSTALDMTNPKCRPAIQDGLEKALRLTAHPMGWRLLTQTFSLCNDFNATNPDDVSNLIQNIIGNFEDVVQYNRDNRGFEGIPTANITIETVCDLMTKDGISSLKGLAQVNSLMLNVTGQKCMNFSYDDSLNEYRKKDWNSTGGAGGRQWVYQTCTEFGWYQSSSQPGNPYSNLFPVEFFEKQCTAIFGPKFDLNKLQKSISRTNIMYGGLKPQVSNVIFVHGSFDPWHALGVTKDLSPDAPAILIPGTSHCANMYPSRDEDSPQLKQAREAVKTRIGQWLDQKPSSRVRSRFSFDLNRMEKYFYSLSDVVKKINIV